MTKDSRNTWIFIIVAIMSIALVGVVMYLQK